MAGVGEDGGRGKRGNKTGFSVDMCVICCGKVTMPMQSRNSRCSSLKYRESAQLLRHDACLSSTRGEGTVDGSRVKRWDWNLEIKIEGKNRLILKTNISFRKPGF